MTPVKASGSPEKRNASGVKLSLSWLFFEYLHLLTQNDENPHVFARLFFVGLVNLRSLRFGNSEKIYDICMRAKQTSAQHQVPKPDLSKME